MIFTIEVPEDGGYIVSEPGKHGEMSKRVFAASTLKEVYEYLDSRV